MNWKIFLLLCTVLCVALPTVRAVEPMSYKEIAMLLRNGEDPQFVINETMRRKLLQPLSPEEDQTLLSLHATPALMSLLRDPANVLSPQPTLRKRSNKNRRRSRPSGWQKSAPCRMPKWRGCGNKPKCKSTGIQ